MDIFIGLAIVATIALVVYLAKHHVSPSLPAASSVVTGVVAGIAPTFDDLKAHFAEELSKVPALVSDEVVRLTSELQAALSRAEAAEAGWEASRQAHAADLAQVASRVAAAVSNSPELPPAPAAAPPPADPAV